MSPVSQPAEQRLLPQSLEDRLMGLVGRIGGLAVALAVAAIWLSLLSWSVTDPSLTHATSGVAQNWLGPLGAIVSDLLLQILGLAAGFALLTPMIFALELLRRERVPEFRSRVIFYPIAVILLAGGLSALPSVPSWPLHHAMGGAIGDGIYKLVCRGLAVVNADRAGGVAGFLFLVAGLTALVRSLGHDIDDVVGIAVAARARAKAAMPAAADATPGLLTGLWSLLSRRKASSSAVTEPMPGFGPGGDAAYWHGHAADAVPTPPPADPYADDVDARQEPRFAFRPAGAAPALEVSGIVGPTHREPAASPRMRPFATARDTGEAAEPSSRGQIFDHSTEAESRSIAERFAPAAAASSRGERMAAKAQRMLGGLTRRAEAAYRKPSLNLLKRAANGRPAPEHTQTALRGNARLLEDVLADFGVKGEIKDIHPGPVVTLYELEPARGTKASRVIGLADDIARSMSASAARVATVPGRNAIGIELPNARRETVLLREILESEAFRTAQAVLPMALGKAIGGESVVTDLARMPHLLVAGTTGSGKSVAMNAFIVSLLYRMTPEECRFLMIDPKMLELSVYNGIPHLLCPVVTEPEKAVAALNWAVGEMEERYKRMAKLAVRNIDVYNNRVRNAQKRGEALGRTVQTGFDHRTGEAVYEHEELALETLPYIVVVVDEFADLMIASGKEIEAAVQRLAQMARAAGIHLIMATQRPSVDIVTGTIKANFPTRISFKVASKVDSRTILNEQGAEQLLGQGDMLFTGGSGQMLRVHGAFVADEEVEAIAKVLREQGEPRYVAGITDGSAVSTHPGGGGADSSDDLYDKAVALVLRDRKASTSYLQRRLAIGYNRAADLIERMEKDGVIGPANSVGKRDILAADPSADAA